MWNVFRIWELSIPEHLKNFAFKVRGWFRDTILENIEKNRIFSWKSVNFFSSSLSFRDVSKWSSPLAVQIWAAEVILSSFSLVFLVLFFQIDQNRLSAHQKWWITTVSTRSCYNHAKDILWCVHHVCKRRARKLAHHYVIHEQIELGKGLGKGLEPPAGNIGETFFRVLAWKSWKKWIF